MAGQRQDTALDPAATDETSANARDGARKRRDPNEPAAVVGIGASAGGIAALQEFFTGMSPESGLAFVVVMHLSPEHESNLAAVLQQKTSMPVTQVDEAVKVKPNHVYVIPPNHQLAFEEDTLRLVAPQQALGRRVTIDLFFRTLAMAFGQRAVCAVLSGADSDGAIGVKHVRAQGGIVIAQEPSEAEYDSMPLMAINTGMVDWVLPAAKIAPKLMEFVQNEHAMRLPPEILDAEPDAKEKEAPGGETVSDETRSSEDEAAIVKVLSHLRARTGNDFSHYKRATVLRRIARRLQVNSLENIPQYLEFLRKHPAEARALLQDLLIGVTHFFRDRDAFASLEAHIPQVFANKDKEEEIRVWVAGCASGEEAYSIAMLLCEHAARLDHSAKIQVFATDIDEESISDAREGLYPAMIEADVSPERLREFFVRDQGRYRVKKEIREKVLFATHNVLGDAPFSRCDLISCRNLLIYLTPDAQKQVLDIFHFALRPSGLLFLGGAENHGPARSLFSAVDAKERIFVRRSTPRPSWKVPVLPMRSPDQPSPPIRWRARPMPALTQSKAGDAGRSGTVTLQAGATRRGQLFGELHLRLLEEYGPPSVVVNESHEIIHLSPSAGRYLQFSAGEPTANVTKVINLALQIELRTALFKAARTAQTVRSAPARVEFDGAPEVVTLEVRPMKSADKATGYFLVLFEKQLGTVPTEAPAKSQSQSHDGAISAEAEAEIRFLKEQLAATVEQYEAANEELKASNEELQAMNEELRSATEQLETSKEELQSVNEELITVNQELKGNVEELSLTNADLNNLMASTQVGTIFLDRELRVHRFTPAAQRIFNLIAADLGRPLSDITSSLKYDGFLQDVETVLRDLHKVEREVQVGDKETWYMTRIAPYRTSEDRIVGVVATFVDISERKKAEDELRASREELERQARVFNATLSTITDFAYLFDREGRFVFANKPLLDLWRLELEEAVGKNFFDLGYEPELAAKLHRQIEEVFTTGETLRDETAYVNPAGEQGYYEYIFSPLRGTDGEVQSVVGSTHIITERKQAELALRQSEARFRAMFEQASVGIVQIGDDARFLATNPGFCQFIGYTREELRQLTVADVTHPEDYTEEEKLTQQLRVGDISDYTIEKRYRQRDGSIVWGSMTATLVRDASGAPLYTLAIVQAIGDRKAAEDKLRTSEERFRTVADNVPQVIWTNDAKGCTDYFNRRWYEYTNLSVEESTGPGWQAVVHPDDAQASIAEWKRAFAAGEVFDAEYRLRNASGEYRWFIGRNVPLRANGGKALSWFGTATDIDDLKQAEAALRESDERFRLLVEGTPDYAMFLLDPENVITYWSAGAEKVFGWSAEEAVGQRGDIIFIAEDKAKGAVEEELGTAIERGGAPDRRWHKRKDGSRLWADGIMRRIDHPDGSLRGFAKICRDATDQRGIEDALRHAKDEMEQRVLERTRDLLATNSELERTMTQRQQLEKELLEISEREKRRIGEDLHDSVCQELTATAFFLKTAAKKIQPENASAALTLEESAQIVNRNVGLTRDLARGLQPAELSGSGLKQALKLLAEQACETADVKCHFKAARGVRVTDDTAALHLYRVAQEALKNAIKHSGANNILVVLDKSEEDVCVTVEDDGKGFSPAKRSKGLGLHIMRYRANALGGHLKIERRKRGGMSITCVIPKQR